MKRSSNGTSCCDDDDDDDDDDGCVLNSIDSGGSRAPCVTLTNTHSLTFSHSLTHSLPADWSKMCWGITVVRIIVITVKFPWKRLSC